MFKSGIDYGVLWIEHRHDSGSFPFPVVFASVSSGRDWIVGPKESIALVGSIKIEYELAWGQECSRMSFIHKRPRPRERERHEIRPRSLDRE